VRWAVYQTFTKTCKVEFQYAAKVVPGGAEKLQENKNYLNKKY
jgi:hypothetical protein